MIVWGGTAVDGTTLGDGARYDPGSKTWTPISMLNAPMPRYDHTVVWTGTEMIIWGGRSSGFTFLSNGARYNPELDQWIPLNNVGAPTARGSHGAVWTGSEMIVWGGLRGDITYGNDGARSSPANNSWIAMTTNGAPAGRVLPSAVWTGNRMVIWGGSGSIVQGLFNDGGRYDPVANSWSPVSTNNAPTNRHSHVTVWTGSEMVIWGGYNGTAYEGSGGRYNAAFDSWSVLPSLAAPSARAFASAVWTGSDMIVWGGADGTNRNTGARYNLAANTWNATTTDSAPPARSQHTAIWSGSEMVVWGGRNNAAVYDDVGRYNPVGNSWTTFAPWVYTLDVDASPLGENFVTLVGTVNPNNTNTLAWFIWGPTTDYGSITPAQSMGSGTNATNFGQSIQIGGGITYHYRAMASNGAGVVYGRDRSFFTPLFTLVTNLQGVFQGSAAWGDYNRDGRLDILSAGRTSTNNPFSQLTQLGRNTGTGFVITAGFPFNIHGFAANWTDYDNDGNLDGLLLQLSAARFYRNSGTVFNYFDIGESNVSVGIWGDYNNDGRRDYFSGSLWRNTALGLALVTNAVPTSRVNSQAWGDYNNDGRLDLLLAVSTSGGGNTPLPAQIWRNTGSGFTNINAGLTGVQFSSVAWGDYDNDGRLDILLTGQTNVNGSNHVSQVWRNTGSGFTDIHAGLPGVAASSAAWGDYDNDGRLDILLSGTTAYDFPQAICQVWRNTGSGFTNINAGLPGLMYGSVAWGDHDNDGRLDILLNGQTTDGQRISQVWRNHSLLANTPPSAPTGLAAAAVGAAVTFSWNAASDAQTPASGLTYNLRIGTTPGGVDIVSPMALNGGLRLVAEMGNMQQSRSWPSTALPVGQPLYWSVQAVDTAFAGSPFAAESSFMVLPAVVSITVTNLVPGDVNGDGVVTQAELDAVLANYLPTSPFLQMTNVAGLGGTNVTFALSNSTAGAFSVEVTTNLVDWNFLGPATPRYLFTDTNAPTNPQRYYRLRWP